MNRALSLVAGLMVCVTLIFLFATTSQWPGIAGIAGIVIMVVLLILFFTGE